MLAAVAAAVSSNRGRREDGALEVWSQIFTIVFSFTLHTLGTPNEVTFCLFDPKYENRQIK